MNGSMSVPHEYSQCGDWNVLRDERAGVEPGAGGAGDEATHDQSRTHASEIVAARDLMLTQTQIFTVQTQVLIQLSDTLVGHDARLTRLEEHQKQSENCEARLRKLESLFELNSLTPTPRNGEANATASAPRPAPMPISEPAPVRMPMPAPSSARATGVRVREVEAECAGPRATARIGFSASASQAERVPWTARYAFAQHHYLILKANSYFYAARNKKLKFQLLFISTFPSILRAAYCVKCSFLATD